jgi:hypothetical protein
MAMAATDFNADPWRIKDVVNRSLNTGAFSHDFPAFDLKSVRKQNRGDESRFNNYFPMALPRAGPRRLR